MDMPCMYGCKSHFKNCLQQSKKAEIKLFCKSWKKDGIIEHLQKKINENGQKKLFGKVRLDHFIRMKWIMGIFPDWSKRIS